MQIVILAAPVVLTPSTLPNATEGQAYSQSFTATGGAGGPYSFGASNLPAGLSLSADGILSGTPTVTGTFTFTISVTDVAGHVYNF